jgi:hypothetical protein
VVDGFDGPAHTSALADATDTSLVIGPTPSPQRLTRVVAALLNKVSGSSVDIWPLASGEYRLQIAASPLLVLQVVLESNEFSLQRVRITDTGAIDARLRPEGVAPSDDPSGADAHAGRISDGGAGSSQGSSSVASVLRRLDDQLAELITLLSSEAAQRDEGDQTAQAPINSNHELNEASSARV